MAPIAIAGTQQALPGLAFRPYHQALVKSSRGLLFETVGARFRPLLPARVVRGSGGHRPFSIEIEYLPQRFQSPGGAGVKILI